MSTPTRKVKTTGDTMASNADLTFQGGGEVLGLPATPSATGAASKEYVYTQDGAAQPALELYVENPSSPGAPSAAGTNAVAIGSSSAAAGTNMIAIGFGSGGDGERSIALGSAYARRYGAVEFSGSGSANGTTQGILAVVWNDTTNATETELYLDGTGATKRLTLQPRDGFNEMTWAFSALIAARRTNADNESAAYKLEGCIDSMAGTVALAGSPIKTILHEDSADWDVAATADDTNKSLKLTVTGENAKNIHWVAVVNITCCGE